jgi:hypothetical protein
MPSISLSKMVEVDIDVDLDEFDDDDILQEAHSRGLVDKKPDLDDVPPSIIDELIEVLRKHPNDVSPALREHCWWSFNAIV